MGLSIDDPEYLEDIRQRQVFPLHIHWDGSVSKEHIFNTAQERGEELLLPEVDNNGAKIHYATPEDRRIKNAEELDDFMKGLRRYQLPDVFDMTIRFMRTPEDIEAAALAHSRYLRSHNVPYAEVTFAPQYHAKRKDSEEGLTIDEVIEHSVQGFQKARQETGVDVKLIIAIGREADPEVGIKVAEAAIRANRKYPDMVIGFGLACEEIGNPPEKHYDAFYLTFDTPLKRIVHAGEMCAKEENIRNIRTSIELLRADGIGHAIQLYEDPDLTQLVIDRGIRIESNPISNNFFFGVEMDDLHLYELAEQGVLITPNPDDPAMIPQGDLAYVLYHLGKRYGDPFVEHLRGNSIRAAFGLTAEQKQHYLRLNRLS